jgi:hypothetical protein
MCLHGKWLAGNYRKFEIFLKSELLIIPLKNIQIPVYNMKMGKRIRFLRKPPAAGIFIFAALAVCVSCSTRLNCEIYSDGRADMVLNSTLMPAMDGLLKNLAVQSGGENGAPVLDASLLNKAFELMTGIESAALRNTAENKVDGRIVISNIGLFFNHAADIVSRQNTIKHAPFAVWEQTPRGGSFKAAINRDTGQQLLSLLTPEFIDYLSALMAPIATGEIIDKDAYLELVGSVYGKTIAAELPRAEILLTIDFPGPVEYIYGGIYRGNHTEFKLPLLDLLVLDEALVYEVRWTPWR